ncbi:MAG TPA: IS200/IS605 family transposase [Cellvibrio sp.]
MDNAERLSHTRWECRYHIVFVPKCHRKLLYRQLRKELGPVLRSLAEQKECRLEQEGLQRDHVHMLISIPPKYSVSQAVRYIKGKSAIWLARNFGGRKRNFTGAHFWARGYFVSTVGRDEDTVQEYIRRQEHEDRRNNRMSLFTDRSSES